MGTLERSKISGEVGELNLDHDTNYLKMRSLIRRRGDKNLTKLRLGEVIYKDFEVRYKDLKS